MLKKYNRRSSFFIGHFLQECCGWNWSKCVEEHAKNALTLRQAVEEFYDKTRRNNSREESEKRESDISLHLKVLRLQTSTLTK